jgi:CO/xanthine dehydrogenase Mo-binding subunit
MDRPPGTLPGSSSAAPAAPAGPVGASVPRVDGVAKVTGRARYLDDLDAPGAWHGMTVRSKIAHGVLEGIDLDPAFDWSQAAVVTAADIPGKNTIALIEYDQPALVPVGGRIMHVDEPVALVAAPTRALAMAAARAVKLRVSPRPPVLSTDDALAVTQELYGEDNVFKQLLIRKGHATDAELDAAFAGAARVIEGDYSTSPQEQMYIEPQAMMAEWTDDGRCHIVGSMQCPYYVHKAMKALLGCGDDGAVITQAVTGGGFGGKEEYPSMIAAHVALLAAKARRPVKIVYDRAEDIAATTKRHPARTRHRLAVNAAGEPIAMDIDVVMDGGAYLTLSPVVLSRGVLHAAGPYRCPVVRVRGRVVATNHPPHGAFRGFGAPQTTFAYERQMQKLARALGEDGLALRKRLALRSGDTTSTGQLLGASVGTDEVLAAIEKVAGAPPTRGGQSSVAAAACASTSTARASPARASSGSPGARRSRPRRRAGSRCARARRTSARARSRSSCRSPRRRSASTRRTSTWSIRRRRASPTAARRWRAAPAWWSAASCSRRRARCGRGSRRGARSAARRRARSASWRTRTPRRRELAAEESSPRRSPTSRRPASSGTTRRTRARRTRCTAGPRAWSTWRSISTPARWRSSAACRRSTWARRSTRRS